MLKLKNWIAFFTLLTMIGFSSQNRLNAEVAYVTDSGGFAYDEARASTNLAPAIALSTVAIVAIIALAVQNSHDHHSSSSSSSHAHFGSSSSSSSSSN